MKPKQIASNLALVTMANLQDPNQANAAVNLLLKTLPHLASALLGDVEIAADTKPEQLHSYYSRLLHSALFASSSEDEVDVTTDEDIENDGVSDEVDDEEADDDLGLSDVTTSNMSIMDAVAALKEVAMGQAIKDAGKFLPLDDIEVVDEQKSDEQASDDDSEEESGKLKFKRKNVMGRVEAKD